MQLEILFQSFSPSNFGEHCCADKDIIQPYPNNFPADAIFGEINEYMGNAS